MKNTAPPPPLCRMFENRVPHMLEADYTPRSALDIFVKDLGIVLGEAKGLKWPLPLCAAAHQQFLAGRRQRAKRGVNLSPC
jgi:putative dehydrogenase